MAWVERWVTTNRTRKSDEAAVGRNLTDMEVAYGDYYLKRGLARGDIYIGKDGLYYVDSKTTVRSDVFTDETHTKTKQDASADEIVDFQDRVVSLFYSNAARTLVPI